MRSQPFGIIRLSALGMAVALLVVGAVSDGILRHVVQTIPLWLIVFCPARPWLKWFAIPSFVVWLAVMVLIWLFLLGIARLFSGQFSPTEIAMTVCVGCGAVSGLVAVLRWRSGLRLSTVTAVLVLSAALQIGLLALSFRPVVARDTAFTNWVHAALMHRP
jgi:hypothetical protein